MQQCPIKHHTAIKTQSYTAIGQRREVEVFGLEYIVSKLNAEVRLRTSHRIPTVATLTWQYSPRWVRPRTCCRYAAASLLWLYYPNFGGTNYMAGQAIDHR